ncbi:MAG: murein hydrolase activator EnvC [Sodalis sp. Fse]|nr:MAG: murein hydrolase activator EnvC [Sodalis sp. Fse]
MFSKALGQCRTSGFRYSVYAAVLCVWVVLSSLVSTAGEYNQQLKTLKKNIIEKEKSVMLQHQYRNSLLSQLKHQEQSISRSSCYLRKTRQAMDALNRDIDLISCSIAQLQSRQDVQEKLLAQQLDAAFRQGQHSDLHLILGNEEIHRRERILAYFSYINQVREKNINDLCQISAELVAQKWEQQQKQNQKQQLFQQQQKQQQTLQSSKSARQKTLTVLNAAIAQDQQSLTELRQNEARLRYIIARAEREAKARAEREAMQVRARETQVQNKGIYNKPSESEQGLMARTSGLGRPVGKDIWPVRGRTLHFYGDSQQGELRYKGLVIAAPESSEVRAIAAGRVLMSNWLQGYGLMVVIEHGQGDMSLYGYNQSTMVNVGDQVNAGQPIALLGSSGGQDIPSLYFEIRRQGQTVNPIPWLGR